MYDGLPGVECTAGAPEVGPAHLRARCLPLTRTLATLQPLLAGMNRFLKALQITFRRDPTNYRPRINKLGSVRDREQKLAGQFFFVDDEA